jgi:hypothetical protein
MEGGFKRPQIFQKRSRIVLEFYSISPFIKMSDPSRTILEPFEKSEKVGVKSGMMM